MQNKDIHTQITYLEAVLNKSELIKDVLARTPQLGLSNWYLTAGAVAQTVWNDSHAYPLVQGLKDCDLVYFDPDISYEAEDVFIKKGETLFTDLPIEVEIRNQARVHLWHEQKFGKKIEAYASTEEGINTFPATAACVGVRYDNGRFIVYAPYGLHDLLGMVVRPNKEHVTKERYETKVERWKQIWPRLRIVPWDI